MTLSQSQVIAQPDLGLTLKSFALWTGILTVCLLIIGFPVGILIVTIGWLLAMSLHAIMPGLGILLVVGSLIAVQILGVMVAAATLTYKGIHPKDVSWLPWVQGRANPQHEASYAACPLTCDVKQ
ncbi:hypothetical protein [Pantanalinema sp. GBBB05]|uniref:hypothetical protein n=1 Tax=Pantanalinema sp. GBBB05 TaxID=2604139 RepID=UPI001DE711BC|nr:hypothetical protein [Pantanalinema sp. GBBB05]